jgi:hypothetical protein
LQPGSIGGLENPEKRGKKKIELIRADGIYYIIKTL